MIEVDLKSLLGKLDGNCTSAMEAGAGQCVSLTHHEVTVEHVLYALLDQDGNDLALLCEQYDIDRGQLRAAIMKELEAARTGATGRPVFSPLLVEWLREALTLGMIEYHAPEVRSALLLIVLLMRPSRFAPCVEDIFGKIPLLDLKQNFPVICKTSSEAPTGTPGGTGAVGGGAAPAGGTGDALARFTINFTEQARNGQIDPVFGRDAEIRQMVDILARRRKNNPIAVGEPGVGKTAVIEGFALRVAEGDVPEILAGVEVLSLDMGLLQAGASVKGEFEKRLKAVIDEVKASPKPIILFIDEAHTLIGAGNQAGGGDAANLLKPALARGELRTIAATTWSEYKKYFEKDPALARRFQVVKLDEPDVDTALTMLRGLKEKFEDAHGIIIQDDAIKAAAVMGSRYIVGRQHPDKGVDLVDTSAARVKISQSTKPGRLEDIERNIQALQRERDALERDQEQGENDHSVRLADNATELAAEQAAEDDLRTQWQTEKEAAQVVVDLRAKLDEAGEEGRESIAAEVQDALKKLDEVRGDEPMVHTEVTEDVVAQVIADWTGIPVGNMVRDEASNLLSMEEDLQKRVKGQDHSMQAIAEAIRAAKAGLKPEEAPMGVFLLVGPSGTGKTETALGVADLLFGGEQFMTTINMSEFMEKHNVSKLIGSPPGYVGYGEGGVLTEAVRQRPYSVVLLDEVEKAHPEVMNLFYQVFDKGELNDGEGRLVDFSNTVLFLTSNLATDIITDMTRDGARPPVEDIVEAIRPALNAHFKPALVARMTITPYYAIDTDTMRMITQLKVNKLVKRLKASQNITLDVSDAVLDQIAQRCTEVDTGARNIDHILRGYLMPEMSRKILDMLAGEDECDRLTIDVVDGEFTYQFSSTADAVTSG